MMDDETRWQDAALPADQLIGPPRPESAETDDAADYDELETGIASIFAAIQAAGEEGGDDPAFDDELTFQLLGELDRLWQRPSP
jgi:hypothetical protein